jgi:SanA protein
MRDYARFLSEKKRLFKRGAAALFGCSVFAVGANLWVTKYSEPYLFENVRDIPSRHTAIVLGARVHPDGRPSATLADRLHAAIDLYRAGKVRKILVSGDHSAPEYNEVEAMWKWLDERGIPIEDVFLDHAGLRTLDTMERARKVFLVKDAVVCTQEFHLPRSVFLARRAGIDAVGLKADRRRYYHRRWNQVREFAARSVSFFDSYVFHTEPKFLGKEISILGDGRVTQNRSSLP